MPRDAVTITPREWFSAAELAELALPSMPTTKRAVNEMAERGQWQRPEWEGQQWRRRAGRGGGVEYHLSVLPLYARAKIAFAEHQAASKPAQINQAQRDGMWDWYSRQPASKKARAEARLRALDAVDTLVRAGEKRVTAMMMVARLQKVALSSLYAWDRLTHGLAREDWLPALAPQQAGGNAVAECTPDAWEMIKADFLRLEQPTFTACYRRLQRVAAAQGWTIPAERTLHRRMMALSEPIRVLGRQGEAALKRLYPAQQRDRSVFHALEAVNTDGHTLDVFCRWPDHAADKPRIIRPTLLVFQDLYSGMILSWRVAESENAASFRLAFGDVVEAHGIPTHVYVDNTRAAANKWMTGQAPTRFRWAPKEDDPCGIFTMLGVQVHFTLPYSGQSKPIERAFRDFAGDLAKHPAFAGAYTGHNPMAKPENYGQAAVPLDVLMRVIAEGVAEHNARTGRRSAVCAGRSFQETYEASYAQSLIRRATPEQAALWMLAAENVSVRNADGLIHHFGNRFFADELLEHRGRKVTVRFDPDNLTAPLRVYRLDGVFICQAECVEAVGFNDIEAARAHARDRREWLRGTKMALDAERRLSIAEVAAMQPQVELPEPPQPKLVKAVFAVDGAAARRAEPALDDALDERFAAALRAQGRPQFRVVEDDDD
jgi:putative transposase